MRRAIPILALCVAAALPAAAQRDADIPEREAGNLYARALLLESGDGDVEAALELYRVLVQQHQHGRVFAARAQCRLATCLEKLGRRDEARRAYEMVIEQFSDQPEAAQQARQALGRQGETPRTDERDPRAEAARDLDRRRAETARNVAVLRAKLEDLAATGDLRGADPVERRLVALEKELRDLERSAQARTESSARAEKLEREGVPADLARLAVDAAAEMEEVRVDVERVLASVSSADRDEAVMSEDAERTVVELKTHAEGVVVMATKRASMIEQLCAAHARVHNAERQGSVDELDVLRRKLEELRATHLAELRALESELRRRTEAMHHLARRAMGSRHRPGPDGRGPESRGSEGRGPEGRGPEGRGPEGRGPEGRGSEGRGPEGRGPEGRGPEGREGRGPEGRGPEGRGPEGRGPEGRGPEGRGSEGRGSEGRGSEGRGSEGRGPEGRGSDDREPEGRGPDGRGPEGRGSDDRGPEGRGPEGRGPEGRGPEGRGPEGRGPEGRGPEGRGPEGRGPEGRGPEGRGPEGRGPAGREPEGRGPEGRPSTGDESGLRAELERRDARIHELETMLEKMEKRLEELERALSKNHSR